MAKKRELNALGTYLQKRSINKAEVCRKTRIHPSHMTELCYSSKLNIKASELLLIAKAIKVEPAIMLNDLFGHLQLELSTSNLSLQEKIDLHIVDLIKAKHVQLAVLELTIQDINRISSILSFSIKGKTDDEILNYLGLQRKSSNFVKTLKACIMARWLDFKQSQNNGELVNTYTTTDEGKKALQVS